MSYMGPSYLRTQGLLPDPKTGHPALTMSAIDADDFEEQDPSERERIEAAGEYRRQQQQLQQHQQEDAKDALEEEEEEGAGEQHNPLRKTERYQKEQEET